MKKLALNLQLQTIQILTNDVQMLILCLSYFITTVFVFNFLGENRLSPILEEDGNLSRIQSPTISNQVSPEPRRRHRHFAEPNGHIPESDGDSGVNRIDVVQEDTIQIEGNLHIFFKSNNCKVIGFNWLIFNKKM